MMINEIFRSLQGEGRNQGRPCTFIRCAGCNLQCRWCDTPQARHGGSALTIPDIIASVRSLGLTYVCLTGGEPLLQEESLALVRSLYNERYCVDIETNGTVDFRPFQPYAAICMDVKCPSSGEQSDLALLSYLSDQDCVKFVCADTEDCSFVHKILRTHRIRGEAILTPVYGTAIDPLVTYILDHNLPVRFQLQLHKVIGVR